MKKLFSNFYVSFVSFIAGMLFIIQCGGGASSIAQNVVETVASALGISYDNSNSNLEAKNVQEALDEVSLQNPNVYDVNGTKIGAYFGAYPLQNSVEVWDSNSKQRLLINEVNGSIYSGIGDVYFTSNDCSGQAYLPIDWPNYSVVNNNLYTYSQGNSIIAGSQIQSILNSNGCGAVVNPYPNLIAAQSSTLPQYQGPLFVK